MNLFMLHEDPRIAAKWNCDQHVVATIREGAIILQAALARNGVDGEDLPYNVDNNNSKNIDLAIWAGENWSNWEKCYHFVQCLNWEFRLRERKDEPDTNSHGSWDVTEPLYALASEVMPEGEETPVPQTHIPQEYRKEDEWLYAEAYREYYRNEKAELDGDRVWWSRPRTVPNFMKDAIKY